MALWLIARTPHATALEGAFHPALREALAHLDRARGPEVYTALREVWGSWDRANPMHVEEALLSAERNGKLSPPARSYAGLLSAYARTRRGDLEAAKKKIEARRWIAVGPFDNEGKAGLDSELGPEPELDQPIVPGRAYSGKERPVRWRALPDAFPYGFLDFGALLRPERKICGFATSFVRAKAGSKAPRSLSIWVGAAGAFKLYWNGREVLIDPAYRGHDADRLAATVTLAPGYNALLVKVCGDEQSPVVSVRLADAKGAPDPALETSNDFNASNEAVKLVTPEKKKPKTTPAPAPKAPPKPKEPPKAPPKPETAPAPKPSPLPSAAPTPPKPGPSGDAAVPPAPTVPRPGAGGPLPGKPAPKVPDDEETSETPQTPRAKAKPLFGRGGIDGPIQSFERMTAGANARPADLEAYARYLSLTSGDDAAEHKARDMARRAAEREPTVERLLLAGELAEDRNQRAEWVGKAEAVAQKSTPQKIEVLLALADVAGTGPNWREASEHYDRVLAIDPDNVEALQGRFELYNTAGLKRTALSTIERALERNPDSVALLNMYATQLRTLGRTSEAADVESRYAGLRFDDHSFLSGQIDLALARRDRSSAERWTDRLLQSSPESQWSLGVAAHVYRSLGQSERAVAMYQRALTLAPEDVGTLRSLADLQGELGHREEQMKLLQTILKIRPQDRDVREYVEHIEKPKPRADEAYAWKSERFLKLRHAPAAGQNRRTLRDLTVTTVFENGLSSHFRQIVFQPLNDAGAAMARQYGFQYQSDSEVVQLRGARVYRGDGRVDEAIESGEGAADDPSVSMYTSARNFYIQFPRLDPGDVVELRYRIDDVTPRNEFADYFGEVTYMQSTEPVQNAEYVLITPKKRTFYVDERVPNLKRDTREAGDQRIYRFTVDKLSPVVPEPSMSAFPEVLGFVHVSTFKTWKELGRWYWGFVKEQFDLDDETRKLARDIAKGAKTDRDKIRAIYDWVVQGTRYVALEFGIYGYKPRRCVQTVARGWGDCKDKATVIVTLLKELGIPSTIVILRTQMRGDFNSKVASLAPFDHAIVYVPSQNIYLDGTAEYTGSTELPEMDAGALGLQVNEGDSKLVHLPELDPKLNLVSRNITATLSANGDAKLDLDYETRGASASEWRRRYHAEPTRRDRVASDLGHEFPGFEILPGTQGISTGNLEDVEQPVKVKVRGVARGFARKDGEALSLAATPTTRLTPTYASLSQRTQDLRVLSFSSIDDTFVIKLPPGHKVRSAPVAAESKTPFGSYKIEVHESPGQISVRSRVELEAPRVTPKQYPAWKKFCEDVDRALGNRLVVGP